MDLRHTINADNFQVIQDDIADATEIAIITVDYRGIPVTRHSRCSEFCMTIRENPNYSKLCEKCDSRGGLEAARLQKPYIYICHAGIIDFAAPIIVDGYYLGAVMAGQVLIDDTDKEKLEHIVDKRESSLDFAKDKKLEKLFMNLPTMSLDKIKAISRMMFHLSNYIVEEAILKISLNELRAERRQEILENKLPIETKKEKKNQVYEGNIILKPAIDYIKDNYNENITLEKMASLCNISSSYFSKLFRSDTKDSLPGYVNNVRIEKAKNMLENSDVPIINISLDLGFSDCGYFIKIFKDIEGVTPAAYRKQIK